jgi:hypothetical protein
MKAHDLARRLLKGPDREVQLEFDDDFGTRIEHMRTLGRDDDAIILSIHTAKERRRIRAEEKKEAKRKADYLQWQEDQERQMQERWGPLLP